MKNAIAVLAMILAAGAPAADETAMNAGALKAVEMQAFLGGDATYLQALLANDYVSVNASGVPRDKATIIKLAQNLTYAVAGSTGIVTSDSGGQRSLSSLQNDHFEGLQVEAMLATGA